jgi:hypothetical protein
LIASYSGHAWLISRMPPLIRLLISIRVFIFILHAVRGFDDTDVHGCLRCMACDFQPCFVHIPPLYICQLLCRLRN